MGPSRVDILIPEWHKTDHGLHLHFAVGRYVTQPLIERVWGNGFVSIKRLSGLPAGASAMVEARRTAGYLSKYVAKTFTEVDDHKRPKGLHRFDVAQGFTPRSVSLRGDSPGEVTAEASRLMGGWPARVWTSGQAEDWQGPPALWLQWDGAR
ncbi:hypothetical protein PROP_03548 [Propionicimonas sp. T2.31MG-18]|uniref:hypothetical protein n=1 Tax=Propionicimonas sp. T2.31MG-18 TaxID=3157620 RepID=UPI0035E82E44